MTTNIEQNSTTIQQEDANNILFPRYFELEEFLPESKNLLTEYLCSLCKGVYHEPFIISCGHIFCKSCILMQIDLFEVCPNCSLKIEKDKIVNVQFLRSLIDKQIIHCKKRIKGCEWTGALSQLKEHMGKACEFRSFGCANAECDFSGDKAELASHKEICPHKKFVCEFCEFCFKISEKLQHENLCEMKILSCQNQCGLELRRNAIQNHLNAECAEALIKCEFAYAGCAEEFKRKENQNHLDTFCQKHLSLLNCEFKKLKQNYELKCKEDETKNKINSNIITKYSFGEANDNFNCNGNFVNKNFEDVPKSWSLNGNSTNITEQANPNESFVGNRSFANRKNFSNEKITEEKANIFNMKEIFPSANNFNNYTNSLNGKNKSASDNYKNVKNFPVEKTEGKLLRETNEKKAKANVPTFDLESSEDDKYSSNNFRNRNDYRAKNKDEKNYFKKSFNKKIFENANADNNCFESDDGKVKFANQNKKEKKVIEEVMDKSPRFIAEQEKDENECDGYLNKKRLKENQIYSEAEHLNSHAGGENNIEHLKKRKVTEERETQENKQNSSVWDNRQIQSNSEPFQLEPETEIVNPYFDMKYISEGLEVCDNKVYDKSKIKPIPYHKFAFVRLNLGEADESWKIQLESKSNWISVGACIKESVVKNNYKFTNSLNDPKLPQSFFGLSSNGFTWNKNVPSENNKKKEGLKFSPNQVIEVHYDAANLTLKFKVDNCSYVLTKVFADEHTQLVPCVVFSKNGDSATYFQS